MAELTDWKLDGAKKDIGHRSRSPRRSASSGSSPAFNSLAGFLCSVLFAGFSDLHLDEPGFFPQLRQTRSHKGSGAPKSKQSTGPDRSNQLASLGQVTLLTYGVTTFVSPKRTN